MSQDDDKHLHNRELRQLFGDAQAKGWIAPAEFPCEQEIMKLSPQGFFPDKRVIFKAFRLIAPHKVKYVILGKDPYPDGKATGIAFDVSDGEDSPSLNNILKGLDSSGGSDGNAKLASFKRWYETEGILFLNAALTVAAHDSGSHMKQWSDFMKEIIDQIVKSDTAGHIRYVAWGDHAGKLMQQALKGRREFTWACHPQPRNGSKCFDNFWACSPVAKSLRKSYAKYTAFR